jgi:hypothetical protein
MITKVFIPQLVQSLLGINWFGFTGLFGSACLLVKEKDVTTYIYQSAQ